MKKDIVLKILVFMVLVFAFTILFAMIQELSGLDYTLIVLPQWGPGCAAIVMMVRFKRRFKVTLTMTGINIRVLSVSIGLPFGLMGLGYLFYGMAFGFHPIGQMVEPPLIILMVGGMLFGAFGEALGWRSFFQNYLHQELGFFNSVMIVGLLWGLWHVGHYSNGLLYMLSFLVFTVCFTSVLGVLMHQENYHVLYAMGFHFSANMAFLVFYSAQTTSVRVIALNALLWLLCALLVKVLFKRMN